MPSSESEIDYTSKEFFIQLLDCMPNLVFIKDDSLRFVYANKTLVDLFATTKEDIIGKTDEDFIKDEEQVAHFRNDDRTVIMTRAPLKISEEFLSDAQGNLHRLATVKVPFIWGAQKLHVLGLATDITSIPTGSSELDSIRIAIISDLAHVIKTPIATAVFNLGAMAHEIERCKESGKKLWPQTKPIRFDMLAANIDYIRQALLGINITSRTFAAIAQGLHTKSRDNHPEQRLLLQLVTEQLSEIGQMIPSARLMFKPSRDANELRVSLDSTDVSLVKTALYNIIHNSIKFSASDKPVAVWLKHSGQNAVVLVEDSGSGIAPEDLPRIFDAGFTRRRPGHSSGTGMGLTIAKETFDRLGWEIKVTSKVHVGTAVQITIPIIK